MRHRKVEKGIGAKKGDGTVKRNYASWALLKLIIISIVLVGLTIRAWIDDRVVAIMIY